MPVTIINFMFWVFTVIIYIIYYIILFFVSIFMLAIQFILTFASVPMNEINEAIWPFYRWFIFNAHFISSVVKLVISSWPLSIFYFKHSNAIYWRFDLLITIFILNISFFQTIFINSKIENFLTIFLINLFIFLVH